MSSWNSDVFSVGRSQLWLHPHFLKGSTASCMNFYPKDIFKGSSLPLFGSPPDWRYWTRYSPSYNILVVVFQILWRVLLYPCVSRHTSLKNVKIIKKSVYLNKHNFWNIEPVLVRSTGTIYLFTIPRVMLILFVGIKNMKISCIYWG